VVGVRDGRRYSSPAGQRLPAEVSLDCHSVTPLHIGTSLGPGPTAHHDLGLGGGTRDDAVHQNPRVAAEVTALAEAGIIDSHNSPSMIKGSTPLIRADP